jgi:hypothetical protein
LNRLALAGRIVVILFAFAMASLAAGGVMTFGFLLPGWAELADTEAFYRGMSTVTVFMGFIIAGIMLLPAMLVVLIAESFRLRSVLIYALVGGAGSVIAYYQLGLGSGAAAAEIGLPLPREAEIVCAAGIAAGFVYWMLAGRNAGRWRHPPDPGQGVTLR